jgi:hypothetical protein
MPHYFRSSRQSTLAQSAHAFRRILKPFPLTGLSDLALPIAPSLETLDIAATEPSEPNAAMREASALVGSAASILNADMAAGVLAARQVRADGSTVKNTSNLTGFNFNDLLRDAHDFVDAIATVLPKLQSGANSFYGAPKSSAYENHELTQLEAKAVRPGEVAQITIKLHNDNTDTVRLVPNCTALLGSTGHRIGEERLTFSPREARLPPDEFANLTLDIRVPDDCAKGTYSGLVKVTGANYLCVFVTVEVV